ncbi:MAG: hypothetical protein PVI89_03015 [Desulfobacteraceae bacterium]|jgi:hypothetical protein
MKYATLAISSIVFWGAVSFAQQEKSVTVGNMPPSVVKTVPQSGDIRVDPFVKEVRARFFGGGQWHLNNDSQSIVAHLIIDWLDI